MKPSVLTIAGSDPSGGAGIQADLRAFAALDVIGLSAITALTVQNSLGVEGIFPVPSDVLAAQIESILADSAVKAIKIGMLGGASQVRAVATILRRLGSTRVVLDPVLASTGGVPLLDEEGRRVLLEDLMPLCDVITPNVPEARTLAGVRYDQEAVAESLAQRLFALGAKAVIIKGGHASDGQDLLERDDIADTLVADTLFVRDEPPYQALGTWIPTTHTHGTGCLHSSVVAACLAKGMDLQGAASKARTLVARALKTPVVAGRDRGYPIIRASLNLGCSINCRTHTDRLKLLHGLYVLTDSNLRPDRSEVDMVRAALDGGASIIQLRNKILPTSDLIALAKRLNTMAREANALFIVNDRVDVAMASDADGVHLGPEDMHPSDARLLLGAQKLIGVSVSSVAEASIVAPFASYLGVGAIFGTQTKSDAGSAIGTQPIREIKSAFPYHPIVGIGGIQSGNIDAVWSAGAIAAAVVSAVICAPDMRHETEILVKSYPSYAP